jgi:hypothetical protein
MAVKKIIKDAFEQVFESGRDMAKSSAKQVAETLSPWDMIRNSFTEQKDGQNDQLQKAKEQRGKGGNNTPLNFDKLQKSYANQDQKKIESMKQRLFQMVKREDEKTLQRSQQAKAEKERSEAQEEAEKRRREEERRRQGAQSNAPEGKSGRGTALSGKKKKRQATEPQPAETKPGGGKQ